MGKQTSLPFRISPFRTILSVGLSDSTYMSFSIAKWIILPSFFKSFIMKGFFYFFQGFIFVSWDNHALLNLDCISSVQCIYYLLLYVESSLHPCKETNSIMICDLFNVLLHLVFKYFMKKFCNYVFHGY